jgi:hypothetical protein
VQTISRAIANFVGRVGKCPGAAHPLLAALDALDSAGSAPYLPASWLAALYAATGRN